MALSNYWLQEVLNTSLVGSALTPPTNHHLALFLGDPQADASGPEVPSLFGYSRQPLTATVFSLGSSENSNLISYTAAGGDWGEITHVGVFDDPVAGNLILYQTMVFPRIILNLDILEFAPGALRFL